MSQLSTKRRVLLVDDDEDFTLKLRRVLADYDVQIVERYDQVLRNLIEFKPQIILLDINLCNEKILSPPDKAGIEILRRIKEMNVVRNIPFIIISGHTDPEIEHNCIELGATSYLPKPFGNDELLQVIEETLSPPTIRLLHLSDLHFNSHTQHEAKFAWLWLDIHDKNDGLGLDTVDFLMVSGDLTNKGSKAGFDRACDFISLVKNDLGIPNDHCVIVPGNHDVLDLQEAYDWHWSEELSEKADADNNNWIHKDDVIFTQNKARYPERFSTFSNNLFQRITKTEYPLKPKQQGIPYLFPEYSLQLLTLNSAWQIDQFNRKRSGLNHEAVANVISKANQQIEKATTEGKIRENQYILKLCMWHHSIQHPESMKNVDQIENLQKAGVRICLHGDVHDMNRNLFRYYHKNKMDIIGAGSFGASAEDRPEAIPRLYNLIELECDLSKIRVHTRQQRKPDGAWSGWYEWYKEVDKPEKVPYYDIYLS